MIAKIIFDLSSNGETKNPLNVNTSIEYIEIYGDVMVIYFDKDMNKEKSIWIYEAYEDVYRNTNLDIDEFCKILKYGCHICDELIQDEEYTKCCDIRICTMCENRNYYFLRQYECPVCKVILF